jgi:hypothetical protein
MLHTTVLVQGVSTESPDRSARVFSDIAGKIKFPLHLGNFFFNGEFIPIGKDGGVGGKGARRGGDGGRGSGFDIKFIAGQSYKFGNITGSLPSLLLTVSHSNLLFLSRRWWNGR